MVILGNSYLYDNDIVIVSYLYVNVCVLLVPVTYVYMYYYSCHWFPICVSEDVLTPKSVCYTEISISIVVQ